MNTVLLQYAVEVEKTGSITQAAGNLYMDQPNLSKAIKTLEESLGAPIFKRTPKGGRPYGQRQDLSGICEKCAGSVRGDGGAL